LTLSADLSTDGNVLQFLGAFVSLSIAFVAFKGHRQTESTSMLRLATAFAFLGIGFLVEGLVGLGQVTAIFTTTVIAGLVLETTGYFFLAFSHAIDVTLSKRAGAALLVFPVITLSGEQLTAVLSILSFYIVLYGLVETIFSYAKATRPDTLLIAGGLAMIGAGTFVQWLSVLYPQVDLLSQVLLLVQILMKEMGLMMLFVPVMNYAISGRRSIGTV
jgi:uncharacterized membrane protein